MTEDQRTDFFLYEFILERCMSVIARQAPDGQSPKTSLIRFFESIRLADYEALSGAQRKRHDGQCRVRDECAGEHRVITDP